MNRSTQSPVTRALNFSFNELSTGNYNRRKNGLMDIFKKGKINIFNIYNKGKENLGINNVGNFNNGNDNSGDSNCGVGNCGYANNGNYNIGDCNAGNWNRGYWNNGCSNVGIFNIGYGLGNEKNVFAFNQALDKSYYEFITTHTLNKIIKISRAIYIGEMDDEIIEEIKHLPNFDSYIFYEITDLVFV